MQTKTWTIVAALALLVPLTAAQDLEGGGRISNVLPVVGSLTNMEGETAPKNGADIISGTVLDGNGELDIQKITLTVTGAATAESVFNAFDAVGETKPQDATDRWRVWNADGLDGVYHFEYEYTYTTVGEYVIAVTVTDAVADGAASSLTVTVKEFIETFATPVDQDGTEVAGLWGGWEAEPGEVDVESNFLRIANRGDQADQRFTITFAGPFTGADGATIRMEGNLQFRCAQTTGVDPAAPSAVFPGEDDEGGPGWLDEVGGGAACTFSDPDALMYIQYRINQVDFPLKAQDYATGFIVLADT